MKMFALSLCALLLTTATLGAKVKTSSDAAALDKANPVKPLPKVPRGIDRKFKDLKTPPTPKRVRLGRWLFFDKRLSKDNTVACASCHRPKNGFSEPTPTSTGIKGQVGGCKAPHFINAA
jgi:cytochrome c peroxidase